MKGILLALLLLFTSCASAQRRPDLEPYIKIFEKHCNCKVNIPIKIVPIDQDEPGYRTLGVCYGFMKSKLFRSIEIDEGYWNSASECERESTVLHELGHCVLNLEHDSAYLWPNLYIFMRPKSLMHPYSFPQYCEHRDEYIKEMFSRK
jgi:hypothetical protein